MFPNIYVIGAIFVALLGSHAFLYQKGMQREREKATAVALEFRQKEQSLIAKLHEAKQKREIVYRDKIKIINEANDACIDLPISQPIFNLLQSFGGEAQRRADPRLRPTGN